jgi:hypothetical protein
MENVSAGRWHFNVNRTKIRGILMYRFGWAREAAESWGYPASPHCEGFVKNGWPKKRLKIEFF